MLSMGPLKNIPHHKRLYEILRKHISDGVYAEGDLLPSENELCQLYGMTRPTVRQSLAALANDGYIIKHQGKGSIVHLLTKEIGILSVSGTTSAVGDRNLKTRIIVKPVLIPWGKISCFLFLILRTNPVAYTWKGCAFWMEFPYSLISAI